MKFCKKLLFWLWFVLSYLLQVENVVKNSDKRKKLITCINFYLIFETF